MPIPTVVDFNIQYNIFINEELEYDRECLIEEHATLIGNLNSDQREVYDKVMKSVGSAEGGVFFVYGYGGTVKTFVWRSLSAAVRSNGGIVLNVASSVIASLFLPKGRTGHSRFKVPFILHEDSTCTISQGTPLVDLMVRADLIIWDKALMMHKHCFEALDKTLRDIMGFKNEASKAFPFGGKTVVLGGDFQQILPVIPKGTRPDIVRATINSSTSLWKHCTVLRLTKNMRLQNLNSDPDSGELKRFLEWIQSIGDGTISGPNDGVTKIDIPEDLLLLDDGDPIASIVASTYPQFRSNDESSDYLDGRVILAPTLDVVNLINDYMTSLNEGECKVYLSSDSACKSDSHFDLLQDVHAPEFLNTIKCSGLPNHELKLKVGTPIMLLRNIDHALGLCNETRLVITKMDDHVLEARIIQGTNAGELVLIPRLSITPSDTRISI